MSRKSGTGSPAVCTTLTVFTRCAAGGARDADSQYLLAQCCLQLGKLPEAEQALGADADGGGVSA